jgi:hypothetical protein
LGPALVCSDSSLTLTERMISYRSRVCTQKRQFSQISRSTSA